MTKRAQPAVDVRLEASMRRLLEVIGHAWRAKMAELDLTPPQALTLRHLDEPRSMRALADVLGIDASTLTGIVDRMEDRGLLVRQPDPDDRRVKRLVLTDEGRRLRHLAEAPLLHRFDGLARLDPGEQVALADLLDRAFGGEPGCRPLT